MYALLREAMRAAGKIGVGQVVIRTTHHLAAVVPSGEMPLMITMRYVNQIASTRSSISTTSAVRGRHGEELELARS